MDRQRLTITLKNDIIKSLDAAIDGFNLRNRSHAIEYFLSQVLVPKVGQAIILAGGSGVKMRPLTYEVPKPLIPVHGRPLIDYIIPMLREVGIKEIIIATGHLGDKIKEYVGNGQKYGVKISYSHESKPLGSAGAIRNASTLLQDKPFLVVNGDVLTKIDLMEFISYYQPEKYVAQIALSNSANTKGYGTVQLRGEKIVKFIEHDHPKPTQLINAGVYLFSPEILRYIPSHGLVTIDEVFTKLAQEEKMCGFSYDGSWFEISTPENYERAIKEWTD